MNSLSHLLLVALAGFAFAAPEAFGDEDVFLYRTLEDNPFNERFGHRFTFQRELEGGKLMTGLYKPPAVLTLEHFEKADIETREISAAPITGLRLTLNETGVRALKAYLSQPDPAPLVIFADIFCIGTVTVETIEHMINGRVLWLIFPKPQEPTSRRYVVLLAEKLQSKLDRRHAERQ